MNAEEEIREKLSSCRPVEWNLLPDFGLYMDQLLAYMSRQLIDFSSGEKLTSAMINNYIKDGLMPRAEGKRYSGSHIAYLTAICVLKKAMPVKDVGFLLSKSVNGDISGFYENFRSLLNNTLIEISSNIPKNMTDEETTEKALEFALYAYASQLVCKQLIFSLQENDPDFEENKTGKKKKNAE